MHAHPIVAESLVGVPDPLVTALRPGPVASGAEVARVLARSLRPEEDTAEPPAWLLPHQVAGFRRILAALKRFGGALLADPVGSGKTYIALAIAAAISRRPTVCLVPAALVSQWSATAARLGVSVTVSSHQQISRGRLPGSSRGLVIIDESHHFRHTQTQRYHHVAPWLVGRPVLLLSATPVVNRLSDLIAQLLLAVRADALALDGVPSLHTLFDTDRSSPALGRLIFETIETGSRPRRIETVHRANSNEREATRELLAVADTLRLSRHHTIAALIHHTLYSAIASSPAAFLDTLQRYRTLLQHARDAREANHPLDRATIRQFTFEHEDQLVLWALLGDASLSISKAPDSIDLDFTDLPRIDTAIRVVRTRSPNTDAKIAFLRETLADGRPTLVFAGRHATIRYLRDSLGINTLAWCTGERAGIGRTTMPREVVWRWFRDQNPIHTGAALSGPSALLTTDVAAEGLDLRRVERVIHYDLPFTPMRLEQREGRAIRLGAAHTAVDVIRCTPAPELERRLGQGAALARKAKLPAEAGLGRSGRWQWRWRAEMAAQYAAGTRILGVATVPGTSAGILAGFSIGHPTAAVLWFDRKTVEWTDEPETISARIAEAMCHTRVHPVPAERIRESLVRLAEPIRSRLAMVNGRRWAAADPGPRARALATRLQAHILATARHRDILGLQQLDRALRFLASGHTAGEAHMIAHLTTLPDHQLVAAASRLPTRPPVADAMEARLTALILFEPD